MKSKKRIWMVLAVLVSLTGLLLAIHLTTRERVMEGALLISRGEDKHYVLLEDLPLGPITGTIVNGKGEEIQVEEEGIEVARVLEAAGLDPNALESLQVVASDEFSAKVSREELLESGRVSLARAEDGSIRLVVFGDTDSKRNVRNVVRLVVSP